MTASERIRAARDAREPRTSVRAVSIGLRNTFEVEVIGKKGRAFMYRSTLTLALATAAKYAELLDAPRQVLGDA